MMAAGMRMGEQRAQARYEAQAQQQAAIEQARQDGAAQAQVQMASPAQSASPAGMDDATVSQLQKLAELHNTGILSDDEFAAAKKKVLGM